MEEHNDFDKLFGSNLPNFADKDWRNLEGQLDRHDLKKQFTRLLWALPALGGILMAISGILYYQLNQTRQQVRSLENRLVSVYEHKKATPEISPPRIMIHDTIYKQIVIREIQTENLNTTNNPNNIYYEKYDNKFTENQIVTEREKYIGINKLLGKNPSLNSSNLAVNTDLSKYKVIAFPEDSLEEDNHFSLIPKSVMVGVLGGIQKPMGNDFEHGGGADVGLRTVLGYNNSKGQEHWGVVLDFQSSALSFDNNSRDKFGKFGSPPNDKQQPNGQKPDLDRVDIPMYSSYKIGVGLRYNFLFNEKIKPYIGAGWTIQIPNQYSIDYHFSNQPTQTDTRKPESINHLWGINTGINVLLSKHLALNGEAYYQSQLTSNTNPLESQPVLGGRIGVSYRFGK